MNTIWLLFKESVINLRLNKVRLFLSLSGIFIGIAAVIIINVFGQIKQQQILEEVDTLGALEIVVRMREYSPNNPIYGFDNLYYPLKEKHHESLRRIMFVEYVSPIMSLSDEFYALGNQVEGRLQGVHYDYFSMKKLSPEQGRFFSSEDLQANDLSAVIGAEIASELFGNQSPLGRKILFENTALEVIAVLPPLGIDEAGENWDERIIIPYTAYTSRIRQSDFFRQIVLKVDYVESIEGVTHEVRNLLQNSFQIHEEHFERFFSIRSRRQFLQQRAQMSAIFRLTLTLFAFIALIVGNIGILAMSLISVTERIQEIGIRRSFGAKKSHIAFQFMGESLLLGGGGALAGLIVGSIISVVLVKTGDAEYVSFPLVLALVAFFSSITVNFLFSLIPVIKAVRQNPVHALRSE